MHGTRRWMVTASIMAIAGMILVTESRSAGSQGTGSQRALDPPLTINATAAAMGTIATGRTWRIQVTINRWSSEDERKELLGTLKNDGPEAMVRLLSRMKSTGYIRVNDSVGYDLRYANHRKRDEGGERIYFATDRPISGWEAWYRPRSIDYDLSVGWVDVNPEGRNDGRLAWASRLDYRGSILELETFSSEPLRLMAVQVREGD